jgi:hypothetical protein
MSSGETADRSRADRGRIGHNPAASDPTLAPLGTDEEAAGTSLSRQTIADAHREEDAHPIAIPQRRGLGDAWILIGFVLMFAVAIIVWGLIADRF